MIDRLFGLLVRLLPRDFDPADRDDIRETYRARIERLRSGGGRVWTVRLRELADLAVTVARARWPLPAPDSLRQDVRVGVRALRRAPVATGLAVASLALGIGATTALFSALDVWLFRPLPLPAPDRLVAVAMANFEAGWNRNAFSRRDYADWSRRTRSLELGIWARGSANLAAGEQVSRVTTLAVSANLPALLGVEIVRGRGFTAEDGVPDAPRVVLVGDRFFQSFFAGDPSEVGGSLVLDGEPHTVVGVMHPEHGLPSAPADLWVPIRISGAEPRSGHSLWGVARLGDGVTLEAASDELGRIAAGVALEDPEGTFPDAVVRPLRDEVYNDVVRQAGTIIGVAVLFVLLIACANIANILLARGVGRLHEMAVRGALGAGRGRLVQQLLVESLLIAALGGALGIGLAFVGLDLLRHFALSPSVPGWATMAIDGRMLRTATGLTIASAVVFGLVPALRTSRVDLRGRLAEGGREGGEGKGGRLASAFVVTEIAASLVLLVLAGLLIRSIAEMRGVDLGFDLDDAMTFRVDVPPASRETGAEVRLFYDELSDRLASQAGVTGVAYSFGHFVAQWSTLLYAVPGRSSLDGRARHSAEYRSVSHSYAEVVGVEVMVGRWFDPEVDVAEGPGVAVVNRALAELWWPEPAAALGQTISPRVDTELRIVGVVENTRIRGPGRDPPPTLFEPYPQRPVRNVFWMVRHGTDPETIAGTIRSSVRALDPDLAVFSMMSGQELLDDVMGEPRVGLRILGTLGGLALALTLVGVYGVVAHRVGRRMHEMGLRVALGAQGRDLLGMVLGGVARTASVGLGLGLLVSLAAGRGLTFLLAGVSPHDPIVLTLVPALLLAAIVVASVVPAGRAAGADPVRVMRGD